MKIIDTDDGSHTIFREDINETYHSRHGALRESRHVYLINGFRHVISSITRYPVRIFELGLGTGMNAILTAIESHKLKIPVKYTAIEPHPLPGKILDRLNYQDILSHPSMPQLFQQIHESGWERYHTIHPYFFFRKLRSTIQECSLEGEKYDLVYYDAFAPSVQPELWEKEILRKISAQLSSNGLLVTYCARGQVKRDLRSLGMDVQSLQGPPGKKEMIRAVRH